MTVTLVVLPTSATELLPVFRTVQPSIRMSELFSMRMPLKPLAS